MRRVAGARKRFGLGVGAPARLGPAAANDDTVLDDHCTDGRIWPGPPEPAPTEREGELHEAGVVGVNRWFGEAQRVQLPVC